MFPSTPTRRARRWIVRCAFAAGLAALATGSPAADRSWTNLSGGNFTTSTNWLNGLPAGVNDVANFNNSSVFFPPGQANYTITVGGNTQVQAVRVKNDFVTLNLGGRTLTTTAITGNEIGTIGGGGTIATARSARLTIQNGTFNFNAALTEQVLIGAVPGGIGSLHVDSGGIVSGSPDVLVGTASATGSLIVNGGTMTARKLELGSGESGRGTAIVTFPFSSLTVGSLLVGNAGSGTMQIDVGATFTNNSTATIGNASGSSGIVTLDGGTTRWIQTGSMSIANSGAGTVSVSGGGSLNAIGANVSLGNNRGSIGRLLVSGTSSRVRMDQLLIGNDGIGIMHVADDASVQSSTSAVVANAGNGFVDISGGANWGAGGTATIANELNSVGRVDVRGVGSTWGCGTLMIGNRGSGRMNITEGARVSTAGSAVLGNVANGAGTVTVDGVGSHWNVFVGSLSVGRNGPGHLQVSNGGRVDSLDSQVNGPAGVVVQGQDSMWVTEDLRLAGNFGSIVVSSGGLVDSQRGQVPDVIGGSGVGTVTGAGSQWRVSTTLSVGDNVFGPNGSVGSLTIADGALVEVGQSVTVGENGTIILNGGTLRLSSLTLDSTAAFDFAGGLLRITGNPSFTGPFLDTLLGPAHAVSAGRHLSVGGTPTLTAPLVLDGGTLTVPTLTAGSPFQFEGGTLNLTSANLSIGTVGLLGNTIVLDDRHINVTNATTILPGGQLIFEGGSFASGGGITNGGQIIVNAPFAASFAAAIAHNGEIRIAAAATANFHGNVTGAGSFTGGGSKFFKPGSNSSVGAIDSMGHTSVEVGATLAASRIREQSLAVAGNVNLNPGGSDASTSVVNSLSMAGGRLDLADNALVVDYAGASPLIQIAGFIQSGFAGGSWNGAGINSSAAAMAANRAIGFAEATDLGSPPLFAGEPVDDTAVLVRLTLPGDANLDRSVNIGDFARLAAGFNQPSTWSGGDFNYDGTTGIADFSLLAANFNLSLPALLPRGATVPETTAGGAFAVAAMLGARRRRAATRAA